MKPRLLDLFCGAGGAARGYQLAGFHVTGVDHRPQPRYAGDDFEQGDALEFVEKYGWEFDAIHASPPCQRYSAGTFMRGEGGREKHPDLIDAARDRIAAWRVPWVIENVERAPLVNPCMLCGTQFGLKVFRHRLFEGSFLLLSPGHVPHGARRIGAGGYVCVAGHGGQLTGWPGNGSRRTVPKDHRTKAAWSRAMGIDWMTRDELAQAIPPAYTEWIGRQLMWVLQNTGRAAILDSCSPPPTRCASPSTPG